MKTIVCFLALVTAALAAAPIVTIDDNLNVIVNGSDWGKAGDVIVNNKANAELVVAVNLALTAKLTAMKSAADASVVAANSARDAALADKATETARVAAIVTALKSVALGVPLPPVVARAILTENARMKAALLAQKAAAEAELAKIGP